MEKNLWCPSCECFPDNITERKTVSETRKWDGDCYELVETDEDDEIETLCGNCSAVLQET